MPWAVKKSWVYWPSLVMKAGAQGRTSTRTELWPYQGVPCFDEEARHRNRPKLKAEGPGTRRAGVGVVFFL